MTPVVCEQVGIEVAGRRLLAGIDLEVEAGRSLAIIGPSGSGKSTLLNAVAGIVSATSGRIVLAGTELSTLRGAARARFRLDHIGIVFQFGELLPEFTAAENVALPLRFRGWQRGRATEASIAALEQVGLEAFADAETEVLSGGERQRVAVARALAGSPSVLIADEPTGSLDRTNADAIADLLIAAARRAGTALLVATHDPLVASRCSAIAELNDGALHQVRGPR